MAENTEIAWCDSTFNPWIGCTKVGPGCDHCYAEADFDLRKHRAKWGPGNPRSRTAPANWKKPLQWNSAPFWECSCGYRGAEPTMNGAIMLGGRPTCPKCLSTSMKRARRRVFCASLGDVFDNEVPESWRADLFALIEKTRNLDWLVLTKRIGNARQMIFDARGGFLPLLPNVWLGATICNQAEADRDIPKLLAVPARVRFLSMEPLFGHVDLSRWLCANALHDIDGGPRIDWVIAGGESGSKARPVHPDWARYLRHQCEVAGVPFLWKQWGEWALRTEETDELCDDSQYGEFHGNEFVHNCLCHEGEKPMYRVGTKAAGRLLDGVLHDAFPEAVSTNLHKD